MRIGEHGDGQRVRIVRRIRQQRAQRGGAHHAETGAQRDASLRIALAGRKACQRRGRTAGQHDVGAVREGGTDARHGRGQFVLFGQTVTRTGDADRMAREFADDPLGPDLRDERLFERTQPRRVVGAPCPPQRLDGTEQPDRGVGIERAQPVEHEVLRTPTDLRHPVVQALDDSRQQCGRTQLGRAFQGGFAHVAIGVGQVGKQRLHRRTLAHFRGRRHGQNRAGRWRGLVRNGVHVRARRRGQNRAGRWRRFIRTAACVGLAEKAVEPGTDGLQERHCGGGGASTWCCFSANDSTPCHGECRQIAPIFHENLAQ